MAYSKAVFRLAPLALAAQLLMAGPAAAQSAPGTQGPPVPAPAPALAAQIDQRAKAIEDKLIAWRRDIHQHPELGNQEQRTSKLVADHLRAQTANRIEIWRAARAARPMSRWRAWPVPPK